MSEESVPTEPPPPDIRPFGRSYPNKSNHDRAVSYSSDPIVYTAIRQYVRSHCSLSSCAWLLLAILAISAIPLASAQSTLDPYTSYPVNTRSSPILDTISWLLTSAFDALSKVTGIDHVSAHNIQGLAKRLDQTGKIEAGMIPVLVALSGTFAGLTLGYFSVDPTQLQVLSMSGTPIQQTYARKILPIRKDSHLLLTTLILGNMIVNEALPVVTDGVLGGGIQAVVISTALVVIFAEIIPQSVCSRYGLLIGATMAKPVRVMMWVAFPVAWPIAKLLEYILGAHHGIIYRRSELRELIKMHAAGAAGGGDLDRDTVTMAQGALDLAQKTVKEAMTSIDEIFMLPIEAKLDYETLGHVVRSGHSRVPVYQMIEVPDVDLTAPTKGLTKTKLVKKILGSLLVKSCVLLDPEDATPLATVPINAIPSVPFDEPLTNMLNIFQEGESTSLLGLSVRANPPGRSHMAIVSRCPRHIENDRVDAASVMTAAAGGLRQRFMRKVAEISHGGKSASDSSGSDSSASDCDGDVERAAKRSKKRTKESRKSSSNSNTSTAVSQADRDIAENKKRGIAQAAKLIQLEQAVPADAQMPPALVEKFFEGLEGAPLGIITLEDVLEELIGEEIYDEYDEHGGPRNAASAFVPREAALAARKAAMDREKAIAQAVPLPHTDDTDLEPVVVSTSAPTRRIVMPKLPMPKFSLSSRPTSQTGRARTSGIETPTPIVEKEKIVENVPALTPIRRTASPGEMPAETAIADAKPPSRSASDKALASRGNFGQVDGNKPVVPLTGLDPVSAVPPRLLSAGTMAAVPGVPPPSNANLLSEALMMERGRRRLAAAGQPVPPALAMLRVPSATSMGRIATPNRQPTPPSATSAISQTVGPPASVGILSPIPVKRTPKFKSVPTPISGTPISEQHIENPMEIMKINKMEKEGE